MTAPGELLSIDADIPEAMEAGWKPESLEIWPTEMENHGKTMGKWGNFTNKPWDFSGFWCLIYG